MVIKSHQTKSIISKPTLTPATSYSYTGAFTVSWPASTDAASGPSYYYLAQSNDFGSTYADASPSKVNSPSTSWTPASALPEGAYRYIVRAYDAAGNISPAPDSTSEYLGDVIVDKTAPTVTSFTVTPATANPTESFTITRAASDAGGSGIKTYQIYRATFSSVSSTICNDSDKSKCVWDDQGDIPSQSPSPNTYYYGIHVTDNALNCITEDTKGDGQNNGGSGAGGYCGGADDTLTRTDFGPIKVTKLSDVTPPTVSSVTSTTADGAYNAGKTINITVNFSEAVTSTGNLTVTLETGTTDRTCTFTASNATSGSCTYTVQTGDKSSDLDTNKIVGTIKDAANNLMTNFVPATNLAASKALVIDTVAPQASDITWKISIDNTTGTAYTVSPADLGISAKTVSTQPTGSTTSNSPTITVTYNDNSGGSGIDGSLTKAPATITYKGEFRSCTDTKFFSTCSIDLATNTFTLKPKWAPGDNNNGDLRIPLSFVRDKAGNFVSGSTCADGGLICITINNQAPIIR